ncbi:MAG: ATP-dependent Clp protease proteolytic subunit [Elusimicrobia bacterium]|nr:ATP-dependent Clp protease proteolytic subunit [Elusimicrobiota bacterium]
MKIPRILLAAALLACAPSAFAQGEAASAEVSVEPPEPLEAAPALAPLSAAVATSASSPSGPGAASNKSSGGAGPNLPSFSGPSTPLSPGMTPPPPMCGGPEKQALDKITTENMIEAQKGQQKLSEVNEARDAAAAHYNALFEQQKLELAPLEFELRKLQLQASIDDAKDKADLEAKNDRLERLKLDNDIARAAVDAAQVKADAEKLQMDVAMRKLDFESRKLKIAAEVADSKTVALKADLDLRAKKEEWKSQANRDPDYEAQPFKDGVLTISDRRIALDGPIVTGVADYVTDRIHYFNNKSSTEPIFIVIDRCPGGSVMEGYRIVKAIQASRAPVSVVVKSYAASMAAVIATLAPHSYAYPNAIILHHQIMSFSFGNLTEQKEQLADLKKWYRRLSAPVAAKMGISLDQFTKEMYQHNSDGNWEEFGDKAVKLKWVDHVVREIRETGIVKQPGDAAPTPMSAMFGLKEEVDHDGKRFMRLPRLQPYDAYWIDNQDGYYR